MVQINIEALKNSFQSLLSSVDESFGKIGDILKKIPENSYFETMTANYDDAYREYFKLHQELSRDFAERKNLVKLCETAEERKELEHHLISISSMIVSVSGCLDNLFSDYLSYFNSCLRSFGKKYARSYLNNHKRQKPKI